MNFKAKSELLVLVFRINVISNFGCRSLCTDFLLPSRGVFRLSLAGSWPGIPCQKSWVGTNSPCLLRLQTRKFLCRKITVRFKLNLKTDGPDCKMIFKFGSRVERLHSSRKQGRRIYLLLLRCKNTCWEIPNPWTASDGCRLSVSKWESLWL